MPCDVTVNPWSEVHIDSVSDWQIKLRGQPITFHALTMIDPMTCLLEILRLQNGTAVEAARVYLLSWLSRYSCPMKVLHDGGPEFKAEFQTLLWDARIASKRITPGNLQSNGIIEAVHSTMTAVI